MSERTDKAELTITARLGQVVLGVARGGGGENNKESGGRETHGEKKEGEKRREQEPRRAEERAGCTIQHQAAAGKWR